MGLKRKAEGIYSVKMTADDTLVDKRRVDRAEYDPTKGKTKFVPTVVETEKRFNKGVVYQLPSKMADRLIKQGNAVRVYA